MTRIQMQDVHSAPTSLWPAIAAAIAAALSILWSAAALAWSPERRCQDRALYAYFAADARDRGVPLEQYEARVEQLVREHPEFGVSDEDIPSMRGLARIVYASSASSPEEIRDRVFRQCMDESI